MYTFNIYVFGHNLSLVPELNNGLHNFDIELRGNKINGKEFKIDFPYHGGQCRGDVYSCVFGCEITDDDSNTNHINEIRNFINEIRNFINESALNR